MYTELIEDGKLKRFRHYFYHDGVTLYTDFAEQDGEIIPWTQTFSLAQHGNSAMLTIWETITSKQLRDWANELDRAQIEAEKYKDQIQA